MSSGDAGGAAPDAAVASATPSSRAAGDADSALEEAASAAPSSAAGAGVGSVAASSAAGGSGDAGSVRPSVTSGVAQADGADDDGDEGDEKGSGGAGVEQPGVAGDGDGSGEAAGTAAAGSGGVGPATGGGAKVAVSRRGSGASSAGEGAAVAPATSTASEAAMARAKSRRQHRAAHALASVKAKPSRILPMLPMWAPAPKGGALVEPSRGGHDLLRLAFDSLDESGDGTLDRLQARSWLRCAGWCVAERKLDEILNVGIQRRSLANFRWGFHHLLNLLDDAIASGRENGSVEELASTLSNVVQPGAARGRDSDATGEGAVVTFELARMLLKREADSCADPLTEEELERVFAALGVVHFEPVECDIFAARTMERLVFPMKAGVPAALAAAAEAARGSFLEVP